MTVCSLCLATWHPAIREGRRCAPECQGAGRTSVGLERGVVYGQFESQGMPHNKGKDVCKFTTIK